MMSTLKGENQSVQFPEALHSYLGRQLKETDLKFRTCRELLDSLEENPALYLKYYRYSKLEKELSFSDYSMLSRQLACYIESQFGISQGDRVLVFLDNRFHAVLCYGALLWLGAIIVPINPQESAEYVLRISARVKAKALIKDSKTIPIDGIPSFEIDDTLWKEINQQRLKPRRELLHLQSPAAIFFTSGTTGHSKGAVLSHGQLLINSKATQLLHYMEGGHIHFSILPLFHVNAFSFSFLTTLYSGARLILNQSFFQLSFWDEIAKEKANVVSLVPNVIKLLSLDKKGVDPLKLQSLKYFVSAAAPLPHPLLTDFYQKFKVRVIQAYGLSETVNFSLTMPTDISVADYEKISLAEEHPSIGTPVFGNEVAVMDPRTGLLLDEGVRGEIVIRGWNVMTGYLDDPTNTKKAFAGNWFHTGDLGFFKLNASSKPQFYLVGRIKEIMKRAGELISLQEVDEEVHKIRGLENAVSVAFPNSFSGEELGLFVADLDLGLSAEEILEACARALPSFKKPRAVAFGDRIPQSPTGKIQRHLLVKHFEAYRDTIFR